MGRGRGKGKKQTAIASHEDHGNAEDEKIPAFRRRGRPTKPLKDDNEEGEGEEAVEMKEDGKDVKDSLQSEDANLAAAENGQKRKRPGLTDSLKEENGVSAKLSTDNSTVTVRFQQSGSRRKNKPRRAAEAVVECM